MTAQATPAKTASETKAVAPQAVKAAAPKTSVKPLATAKKAVAKKATTKAPAKPVVKAAVKPASQPAAKTAAKPATPKAKPVKATKVAAPQKAMVAPKPAKLEKPAKVKKPKLVRDSFTIPKDEYEVIDALKMRGGKLGQAVKKSELLRAGIKALAAMSDIQFKAALIKVPTIKTGRPTNAK
ncbi:hypothetical protein MCEMAEM4_02814 [Burkholderiaceae bacterium]